MTPKHTDYYNRALKRMPWATQTNAKRLNPEWASAMPPFIRRAEGCRVWDLDGKEYIDYRCALGPIILGYHYPEVDAVVEKQLRDGVLFSMASPLELEAAEAVAANVPWIEQIRFMKTGADACTACIRLARAHTKRDHIVTAGYHGYHDWFVTDWPDSGIPSELQHLVHRISYGDSNALCNVFESHAGKIAAVIVEPYEWGKEFDPEFLRSLRKQCDQSGALLVFDEILTGFRLANAGAQEYAGVTPDLAAYAKALANGYPLAAFAGKTRFMQQLENTVITGTYAGEALSLAACTSTMSVVRNKFVVNHIREMGERLCAGFTEIFDEVGVPARMTGLPNAPMLIFELDGEQESQAAKGRFYTGLFSAGVFPNDPWFISYAHQASDIEVTLERARKILRGLFGG